MSGNASLLVEHEHSVLAADLRAAVAAAVRAPSGDNLQPWIFSVDVPESCIDLRVDPTRDVSPMNSGQKMSLIACGAAIENALREATARGWQTRLELPPAKSPVIARIHFTQRCETRSDFISHAITERVCNRRVYDGRDLIPAVLSDLKESTPERDGVNTRWLVERSAIKQLAQLIARADAIMFGEPSLRHAILSNVRFDLPPKAAAETGLPLASLEAGAPERTAMRLMRHLPQNLFSLLRMRNIFSTQARKLVESASGLCVVAIDAESEHGEIQAGRALQRAWLSLTELGLAAQPMMSLLVLDNALRNGPPELVATLKRENTEALLNAFRSTLKSLSVNGRPAFLLRFGYAAAPSGRTGRLTS